MKKLIAGILALFGMNSHATQEAPADASVMDGKRSMALSLTADKIGLSKQNYPHEVFGILMETGFDNGSFTLLVLADGTTSLYYSTGGGIIGAGTHENVQKASSYLILASNHFRPQTKPTTTFPYPKIDEVKFYMLGYSGVTTYSAVEQQLGEGKDPLSDLFHASHMVITELRQIQESKPSK